MPPTPATSTSARRTTVTFWWLDPEQCAGPVQEHPPRQRPWLRAVSVRAPGPQPQGAAQVVAEGETPASGDARREDRAGEDHPDVDPGGGQPGQQLAHRPVSAVGRATAVEIEIRVELVAGDVGGVTRSQRREQRTHPPHPGAAVDDGFDGRVLVMRADVRREVVHGQVVEPRRGGARRSRRIPAGPCCDPPPVRGFAANRRPWVTVRMPGPPSGSGGALGPRLISEGPGSAGRAANSGPGARRGRALCLRPGATVRATLRSCATS